MSKKMLRVPAVLARTGFSRVTLWRRVRDGIFPAPVELGPNMIGWPEESIEEFIEALPRRTYGSDPGNASSAATPGQEAS